MLPENFHKKDTFINTGMAFLFNDSIYEYDIVSANTSIMEYYALVDNSEIKRLKKLPKSERVRRVGIMQKKDRDFTKALSQAFSSIRKEFYDANNVEPNEIISVKKDAIFMRKECFSTKFGNVKFAIKNKYTSFMLLDRLEIYYRSDQIDVKGISEENLVKHEDGIIEFIVSFLNKVERLETRSVLKYLNRYATDYKFRKLPISHYREFNHNSRYVVMGTDDTYDDYWSDRKDELDIGYNWTHIVLPIITMMY